MASLVAMIGRGHRAGSLPAGQALASIARGSTIRSETVTIGGTSAHTTMVAAGDEGYLTLKAGGECWVNVGVNAVAEDGVGIHLFAQERFDCFIAAGERIAVIAGTAIVDAE